jgi:predicted ester cyclase
MGEGRAELADELIANDYIYHERGREDRAAGPHGQRQAIKALHDAFSDFKIQIEDIVVCGDRAAVRDRISGLHTGSFAGIPPRGKRLDLMRLVIYRVQGGKIRESWAATDVLAMVKQLGGRS